MDYMVLFVVFWASNRYTFCHAQKRRLSCSDTGNCSLLSPDLTKMLHALEPLRRTRFGHYSDPSIAVLFVEA